MTLKGMHYMDYKDLITEKIKDEVNNWINKLKEEYPKLGLTRQWKVHHTNGFTPGVITLPVITGSKKGNYLISEVTFQVPSTLELDIESIELTHKNEPYKELKKETLHKPISEPLSILNEMIVSVNHFLHGLNTSEKPIQRPLFSPSSIQTVGSQLKVKPIEPTVSIQSNENVGFIIQEIKKIDNLPLWLSNITSREVKETLTQKIAEGYLNYRNKGNQITLPGFLKMYEEYLKKENKLKDYCKYKNKEVVLDNRGFCTENYCSKKPFNSVCTHSTLKFGK